MSWRRLLSLCAEQQLGTHGAFLPFGAVVTDDGAMRLTSAYDGAETPSTQELLDQLYEGTRSQRSSIRAVAFVADVRIPGNPEDAIRVELEHRGGIAIAVLLPYRKRQQSPGVVSGPQGRDRRQPHLDLGGVALD